MRLWKRRASCPAAPPSSDASEDLGASIRHLPPDSPVREIVADIAARRPLPSLQPLIGALMTLAPKRWKQKAVLARAIGQADAGERDREVAASVLCGVLENRPQEKFGTRLLRGLGWACLFIIPLQPVNWLVMYLLTIIPPADYNIAPYTLLQYIEYVLSGLVRYLQWPSLVALPALSLCWDRVRYRRANCVRDAAARALGHLGVPDSVPTLARALSDRDHGVRQSAAAALEETLPALTSEHYGLLDAQAVTNLGRALQEGEEALTARLLEALEKVGTSQAIPFVERETAKGPTQAIRDQASRVLAVLEERRKLDRQRETLLRPATAPDAPSEVLLRPARDTGEINAQLLLRPSSSEEA